MIVWNNLKETAALQPDKPVLTCGDTTLTYARFLHQSERLAKIWLQRGLKPGDRIALHLRNGLEFATCYYACFAAGFVAVPINNRLTPDEIAWILDHSGSRAYVSQPELRVPTSIPGWEFDTPEPADCQLTEQDPDAPALILYTSGTTGRPKGVTHTHRTIAGNAVYLESSGVTAHDRILLFTSMAHATGSIMLFICGVLIGSPVTIVPLFDPAVVLDTWARSGATYFMSLPTMIRAVVVEQRARPRRVAGHFAISGGDTVPVALQQEFEEVFHFPLLEGFGMTEGGLPMFANRPDANRPGSMGRAMGDVELRVVDGEMWVRGCGITKGYWRDVPFEDGWLKTGDLVDVDADGYVWFRGRRKEIIIRGGSNISPQEVEETLYRHPAVAEAGVIGEPDSYWGEIVIAYVAVREGHEASAENLISFARGQLAEYKCPALVLFLPALPKGITGKVHRRSLKDLHAERARSAAV